MYISMYYKYIQEICLLSIAIGVMLRRCLGVTWLSLLKCLVVVVIVIYKAAQLCATLPTQKYFPEAA